MNFNTLGDLNFNGKKVLLRADLNVPAQRGKVTDTTRIDRLKPTIDFLVEKGAKILLLSHFGRPEGEQNPEMSLAFLLPTLQECWGHEVSFAPSCIGDDAKKLVYTLQNGEIALLENLRFHKGEKKNDPEFCKQLAELGDIYVNDAFSASHRAHASTEGLAHLLPTAAGRLMEAELNALSAALEEPEKPVAAIVGGSKISTKLSVLKNLVEKTDFLILGGAMANTFVYAQGGQVGASMCESDMAEEANNILAYAQSKDCEIILPKDCICVETIKPDAEFKVTSSNDIPDNLRAIDIGPKSIKALETILQSCKTVLWNGPLGVFEIKPFDRGTNDLAHIVAKLTNSGNIKSIAGGGDTTAALENAGCIQDFSYISTAGGAFLEWLQGETLPGVAALSADKKAA